MFLTPAFCCDTPVSIKLWQLLHNTLIKNELEFGLLEAAWEWTDTAPSASCRSELGSNSVMPGSDALSNWAVGWTVVSSFLDSLSVERGTVALMDQRAGAAEVQYSLCARPSVTVPIRSIVWGTTLWGERQGQLTSQDKLSGLQTS